MVEQLRLQLKAGSLEEREAAAECLSRMGSDAMEAAVELVLACKDAPTVRDLAIATLEDLGAPPVSKMALLTDLISASEPLVAYWAVTLVGRLGADASECEIALASALSRSEDLAVRQRIAWALGQTGVASNEAVLALDAATQSSDARLARLARAALEQRQAPSR